MVRYKENVLRSSRLVQDQINTPREVAVFWTEYVIRHRGAPQLRSPVTHLSWVQFYMFDVLLLLCVVLLFLCLTLSRIITFIFGKIFRGKEDKRKKD
ncbi:UDP-glucuronosyltransferase 1-1-like 1 [Homarus americanus]|uniref:UDP-glucuronosyltransferase 1-1-like 1 n=1 Tax=Homarus americanus TaxID=6706 RepID=A0A8J5JQ95_HOMAM|nr:UDP-glucuronosyltransferase 1-1-like 2 [Homarus americanus]KAG7172370.1 UDP-glucuronosyltransferase 1-1-like 1 [Homarus americanus]